MRYHDGSVDTSAPDELSSHTDAEPRGWWRRTLTVAGVLVVALVAVLGGVNAVKEVVPDRSWPTGCGIDGHANWCARPSAVMTGQDLAVLAQASCPAMSGVEPRDVVPQLLTPIGPPDRRTRALTSGTVTNGSEQALLGRPGRVTWVTRQVGGPDDGRVRVSCPGAARTAPGLRLDAEQVRAVVASRTGEGRGIDLTRVAREMAGTARGPDRRGVSFGFVTCDTRSLDPTRRQVGERFSCAVEVYGALGQGAYRATYRVTDRSPYFARVTS